MDPISDLIKLISSNPNLKDEDLYKSFPQLKGNTDLTRRARAYAIGKSSGDYNDEDLDKSFPDVVTALTPKQIPQPAQKQNPQFANPEPVHAEDENDPIGSVLHPIQDKFAQLSEQRRNLSNQYSSRDNLQPVHTPELHQSMLDISGQQNALLNQQNKIKSDLQDSYVPAGQAKQAVQQFVHQTTPDAPDVDGLSIQQIQKYLPLNKAGKRNETAQWFLDQYSNQRNVSDALSRAKTIQEAAVNYAYSTDEPLYDQLRNSGNITGSSNAAMAEAMNRLLANPATKEWASASPDNQQSYQHALDNMFQAYPSYGKKIIAETIANEREKRGMNNWLVTTLDDSNDPNTVSKNDELFNDLVKSGQIPQSAIPLYKSMRGNLKDYVPTSGLINNILGGLDEGLGNTESFFKDWFTSGNKATYDALEKEYSKPNFKPIGALHDVTTNVGEFTGQMIPLMLISKGLASAGVSPSVANAIAVGATFEHPNREKAALLFPGDTSSQNIYTAASTAVDMAVGSLYDRSKALDAVNKELKPQIREIVNEFSSGKITSAAAKDLVQKQLTDFISKAKEFGLTTAKHNLEQSAQMAGFSLAHSLLDKAFGSDQSMSDSVDDAVKQGTTAFLYGGLLSAMAAHGESKATKITASSIWDMASKPDPYRDAINRDYTISPEQKNEKLQNLEIASSIKDDLDNFSDLTIKQKQKALLHELNQKVVESQMKDVTSNTVKDRMKQQIKESKEAVQKIFEKRDGQIQESADNTKQRISEILNPSNDAVSEQSPDGTNVQPTPSNSEEVGGGNEKETPVNEEPAKTQEENVRFFDGSKFSRDEVDKSLSEELPEESKAGQVSVPILDKDTGKMKDKQVDTPKAFKELKTQFRRLEKVVNNCL